MEQEDLKFRTSLGTLMRSLSQNKKQKFVWESSPVVEHLVGKCEALASIPTAAKINKQMKL